jgi:hypothetical protein
MVTNSNSVFHFGEMFKGGLEKSQVLAPLYEAVAEMGGGEYLNAGSVISTDGIANALGEKNTRRRR